LEESAVNELVGQIWNASEVANSLRVLRVDHFHMPASPRFEGQQVFAA